MSYKLDTLVASIKSTREYIIHDSVFNVLKQNNIDNCNFPYKLICKPIFGGFATSYADNIKLPNGRIETSEASIRIGWNHPEAYQGKHYILLTTFFGEHVDIKETRENFVDLNLLPYKRHTAIIYKVISAECRESDQNIIVMK
jgi:hypothetical protein